MDPITLLAAGAGASVLGGLLGGLFSSGDRQNAINSNQQAVNAWLNVHVPDPQQQQVFLQQYVQTGKMDPALQQAVQQDASQYKQIQSDPTYKNAQLSSLSQLQDIGSSGGMQLSDKANLQNAINDTNTQERGQRGAILDNMQSRGIGGSGLSLAAQLDNQQNSANRLGNSELQTAASARDRALNAIMGGGQLAGQLGQQDYQRQANAASAQDAINQFNTRNLQGVNAANVGIQNQAQAQNLQLKQGLSNANTDMANQQQLYNKNLQQQQFNNQAQVAGGIGGAYQNMANSYSNNANRTAGQLAGAGSAIGQGLTTIGAYQGLTDALKGTSNQLSKTTSMTPGGYAGSDSPSTDSSQSGQYQNQNYTDPNDPYGINSGRRVTG